MSSYRVSFYNELVNSQGRVFKVCQRSVEVRSARTIDRAITAAKRKFENEEGIGHWRHRARSIEVEPMPPKTPVAQATTAAGKSTAATPARA
jgi:hypothetical protein